MTAIPSKESVLCNTLSRVPVVCPSCQGPLVACESGYLCSACAQDYRVQAGFPDFIIGERFDDLTTDAKLEYEEQSNRDLTLNYLLPMFQSWWPNPNRPPRLLSLGCGSGADIDLLTEHGFDCLGIDCGNRSRAWQRRRQKSRLLLANGKRLPFGKDSFDAVFCGCVFPHVGVVGDSARVTASYFEERLALAREMARVLAPNGKIVVSSPNRLFPLDLFHGRNEGSLRPRFNWIGNPFLLSVGDYKRLFSRVDFTRARTLTVKNYWGFVRSKNSWKGRLLGWPVRGLFWGASTFPVLRNSPLNPWLVVLLERGA